MSQPFTQKSSRIFISYRREENADAAGRLCDNLMAHFGADHIFMDVDYIEPGEDFVQVIKEAVSSCQILIAVIGKGWLASSKDGITRRLDNPNDFVRLEIATALSRNVRVIPVLVQRAEMPSSQDLPDDLTELSRRHAFELSHTRWKRDVESLISSLQRTLEKQQQEAQRKLEEEEAARRAAEELKLRREEEARQQRELEARQRAEEEERRRAEQEQLKEEQERQQRLEEEKRRKAEEAARQAAEEQQREEARKRREDEERRRRAEEAQEKAKRKLFEEALDDHEIRVDALSFWPDLTAWLKSHPYTIASALLIAALSTVLYVYTSRSNQATSDSQSNATMNTSNRTAEQSPERSDEGGSKANASNVEPQSPSTMGTANTPPKFISRSIKGMMLEMVYVPGGMFTMGSPETEAERYKDEGPQHRVTVKGFYMGKYEVTQEQWLAASQLPRVRIELKPNPSVDKCERCPVSNVSWNDAQEFIARLNRLNDGYTYRLPTEAEWEYACRAGTTTPFSFGDSLSSEQANFNGNYPYGRAAKGIDRDKLMPVGSFQPNSFGLYDMHGNVWEWCQDVYHNSYNGAPANGSAWQSGGEQDKGVERGGSWASNGHGLRSAYRLHQARTSRDDSDGFRLVALPVKLASEDWR